jgi:hypothetical protein
VAAAGARAAGEAAGAAGAVLRETIVLTFPLYQ